MILMGKKLDPNKIKVNPAKFAQRGGEGCHTEVIAFMECMKVRIVDWDLLIQGYS